MLILFIAIISLIEALFLKKLKAKSLTEIFLKSVRRLYLVTEARESLQKRKIGAVRESESFKQKSIIVLNLSSVKIHEWFPIQNSD